MRIIKVKGTRPGDRNIFFYQVNGVIRFETIESAAECLFDHIPDPPARPVHKRTEETYVERYERENGWRFRD